jgi:hypothetical protein
MRGGAFFDTNYTTDAGVNSGVIQYLYYFFTIAIITLLILVLVHFTITPIFKTRPGAKGYIPLPGSDDSSLYWKKNTSPNIINDIQTSLGSTYQNWSMLLDIQIDNPTSNTNYPRLLFLRGKQTSEPTGIYDENDTILKIAPDFNLAIYLDRLTNDLNVSVQTLERGMQTLTIQNVPVRKPIRLGVMAGSRVLEVYINGYLVKSKAFTKDVRNVTGVLQPPFDSILSTTAQIANLRVWPRPLSPSEFRSYGSADGFQFKQVPDSCAS